MSRQRIGVEMEIKIHATLGKHRSVDLCVPVNENMVYSQQQSITLEILNKAIELVKQCEGVTCIKVDSDDSK